MTTAKPTLDYDRPAQQSHGAYRWWVIVMLWFICFFNNGDRQAINSIFPVLKKQFGFDTVQLGLIGSVFMWVYATASALSPVGEPEVKAVDDLAVPVALALGGLCVAASNRSPATYSVVRTRRVESVGVNARDENERMASP